jgi:hypothetical protein
VVSTNAGKCPFEESFQGKTGCGSGANATTLAVQMGEGMIPPPRRRASLFCGGGIVLRQKQGQKQNTSYAERPSLARSWTLEKLLPTVEEATIAEPRKEKRLNRLEELRKDNQLDLLAAYFESPTKRHTQISVVGSNAKQGAGVLLDQLRAYYKFQHDQHECIEIGGHTTEPTEFYSDQVAPICTSTRGTRIYTFHAPLIQNLLKRESLKFDKDIRTVLERIWSITDVDKSGSIEEDEYRAMFRRLYTCVIGKGDLGEIDALCSEVKLCSTSVFSSRKEGRKEGRKDRTKKGREEGREEGRKVPLSPQLLRAAYSPVCQRCRNGKLIVLVHILWTRTGSFSHGNDNKHSCHRKLNAWPHFRRCSYC